MVEDVRKTMILKMKVKSGAFRLGPNRIPIRIVDNASMVQILLIRNITDSILLH